jgi:hypothetical protein
MRTTLTLDADVARTLKAEVRRGRVTFKEAVNRALRAGLGLEVRRGPRARFVVRPHSGGFMAGIDPHKLNRLADELEDDAVLEQVRRQ